MRKRRRFGQAVAIHQHALGPINQLARLQPLAQGRVSADPTLNVIATKHDSTASGVSLAFLMNDGHIVIPASSNSKHLRDNFAATSVSLSTDEIGEIRKLDRRQRIINPSISPQWDD